MSSQTPSSPRVGEQSSHSPDSGADVQARTSRRSFLAGAGAGAMGLALLANVPAAMAGQSLTAGDEAILRFLAAAEILETDLWQQYNELGGIQDSEVPGGTGNSAYTKALSMLDSDMSQYIHDNTDDEFTSLHLPERLPRGAGRTARQPGAVPHTAQQHGDRRAADQASDQPDAADGRHHLVDAVSQQHQEPRLRAEFPTRRTGADEGPVPRDPPLGCRSDTGQPPAGHRQHRRLSLRHDRTGRHQSLPVPRPEGDAIPRCCGSCSASVRPRPCTSRRGATRRATLRR